MNGNRFWQPQVLMSPQQMVTELFFNFSMNRLIYQRLLAQQQEKAIDD